jgi:hypothetical protein
METEVAALAAKEAKAAAEAEKAAAEQAHSARGEAIGSFVGGSAAARTPMCERSSIPRSKRRCRTAHQARLSLGCGA